MMEEIHHATDRILRPRPVGQGRGRLERVGLERTVLLVLDDFLLMPERLLKSAYSARFAPPHAQNFPGIRAAAPLWYARYILETLVPIIRGAYSIGTANVLSCSSEFSLITTAPENLSVQQRIPHTDGFDPNLYAVLHFLTIGDCFGTSFYRHKTTGYEYVNAARKRGYLTRLNAEIGFAKPLGYMSSDNGLFERTATVEGRFNRLIVYPGHILHYGQVPNDFHFSADPREGRLTANTFITFGSAAGRVSRPDSGIASE